MISLQSEVSGYSPAITVSGILDHYTIEYVKRMYSEMDNAKMLGIDDRLMWNLIELEDDNMIVDYRIGDNQQVIPNKP